MPKELKPIPRCSNCQKATEYGALVFISDEDEDGNPFYSYSTQPKPIGISRKCYLIPYWLLLDEFKPQRREEAYVYPGEDDSCIYPKRFKPKQS